MAEDRIINNSCGIELAINRQRVRQDGSVRLYLRISVENHRSKLVKLRYYWPLEFYDINNWTIKPRFEGDPLYLTYLATIETEKAKYWEVIKSKILKDEYFAPADVIEGVKIFAYGQKLAAFMAKLAKSRYLEKDIKEQTRKNHVQTSNAILQFTNNRDIAIAEVSKAWVNSFTKFLMKTRMYSSAWTHVKNVKSYIRAAKKLSLSTHPSLDNFPVDKPDHEPDYLEKDELDRLISLYNNPEIGEENRECARAFLFSCFTGMRISDMKRFDSTWIDKDEMIFEPVKRRLSNLKPKVVKVPIIPFARGFILNFSEEQKLLYRSEQKYNKRLKKIAQLAGIERKISSKTARHIFATNLAIANVPLPVISDLMGHSSTKTTQKYIHIAEQVRKREMDKMQAFFGNAHMKLIS